MKAHEMIHAEQGGADSVRYRHKYGIDLSIAPQHWWDDVEPSKYQEFSVQRGAKRFTVRALSAPQAAKHRRVLIETSEEVNAYSLQTLGLTKRFLL